MLHKGFVAGFFNLGQTLNGGVVDENMKLGEEILKVLNKKYPPSETIDQRFQRYDMTFKTDENGNPILLFLGRRNEKGNVVGDRYARTLKYDNEGRVIKDHWERKGPAT